MTKNPKQVKSNQKSFEESMQERTVVNDTSSSRVSTRSESKSKLAQSPSPVRSPRTIRTVRKSVDKSLSKANVENDEQEKHDEDQDKGLTRRRSLRLQHTPTNSTHSNEKVVSKSAYVKENKETKEKSKGATKVLISRNLNTKQTTAQQTAEMKGI